MNTISDTTITSAYRKFAYLTAVLFSQRKPFTSTKHIAVLSREVLISKCLICIENNSSVIVHKESSVTKYQLIEWCGSVMYYFTVEGTTQL